MTLPTSPTLRPEFIRLAQVPTMFGLSARTVKRLIHDGKVKSHLVRAKGRVSGCRLISTDSLREFITSHSSGFEQKGGE